MHTMVAQEPKAPAPMTHQEVAHEYGRALTDPEHPMYRHRHTEKFKEWADALYARIADSDTRVTRGEVGTRALRDDRASDATVRDDIAPT
jgi:hypothetical protein